MSGNLPKSGEKHGPDAPPTPLKMNQPINYLDFGVLTFSEPIYCYFEPPSL